MRKFPYLVSNVLGWELIIWDERQKNIDSDWELSSAAFGVSARIISCEKIIKKGAEFRIFPGVKLVERVASIAVVRG
jgi:hypothetical protein